MLDPPDDEENDDDKVRKKALSSSSTDSVDSSEGSDLSESTESEDDQEGYSSSDFESDISDDEQTMVLGISRSSLEQGDKPGIQIQDARDVSVTQPAFRDAWEQDLHADDAPLEELDEDHLTSYTFGKIYASSGLRRMTRDGRRHEIDWALIEVSGF